MRARGAAFLRGLGRLGFILSIAVFVGFSAMTTIRTSAVPGFGSVDTPDTRANQATMDKAAASAAGQQLKHQGYTAKEVVSDSGLVKWLAEQEKHGGVANPGPFVRFSTGATLAAKPDPSVAPDVIVDANQGVDVALYQGYSDERGAACYNASDIRTLSSQWVVINVYLWSKSLDQQYEVKKDNVPQLPASIGTVQCYTFVP